MNLIRVDDLEVNGKKVIVRGDLDVGTEFEAGDDLKLQTVLPTLKYLIENNAKVILIGHRGRPGGTLVDSLTLGPMIKHLGELLGQDIGFVNNFDEVETRINDLQPGQLLALENLRFWSQEEENDQAFAKKLSSLGEIYVNEAFSVSHREHASIVALPLQFKSKSKNSVAFGKHFIEEVEHLNKVLEYPDRPVVIVIGGAKEDKVEYVHKFKRFADKVLVGGRLPLYLHEDLEDEKLLIAKLNPDKEDITLRSAERFEEVISTAKTIMVNGPMGRFEEEGQRLGTKKVFEAIAGSSSFKVAGGGDTEQAIKDLGLTEKFNWVSVGGGASLDFLADGTLPGIEVIEKN